MSIPSITASGRVSNSTASPPQPPAAAEAATRSNSALPETSGDEALHTPTAPRFPWLSRLTQQLESASKQRPAFEPAPILGDHVDKSA